MKPIKIFNSISKTKENFQSKIPGIVTMYVCGMTVYDDCHLGHARTLIAFDTIKSILEHCNYKVSYARNITDIDDKIINKAQETNSTWQEVATKYINNLEQDTATFKLSQPCYTPKATDNIPEIQAMITTLIEKNHAYVAPDGDVYFAVKSWPNYGKLSNQNLEELLANARKQLKSNKSNSLDFILWKQAKPGEPSWKSPWGAGRPGWHIECSAMLNNIFGNNIDIHGGGIDLKFPHHENEIAQSEACFNNKLATYWMHTGHVMLDKEKMSKSLGNFITIKNIIKTYHPEVVKYFLLATHYRSPINYQTQSLQQAKQALLKLYQAIDFASTNLIPQTVIEFDQAITDDFNIPQALSVCFKLAKQILKTHDTQLATDLKNCLLVLGLGQTKAQAITQYTNLSTTKIEDLIKQRNQAKLDKNWELADKIRDQLLTNNIILEDNLNQTTWKVK